jgi:adenylate cyclase
VGQNVRDVGDVVEKFTVPLVPGAASSGGLTAVELLLIHLFSRRLSRPIEGVSQELRSVEDLSFKHAIPVTSNIKEIRELQAAVGLFETSLRSFSSFVPLDVVRKLIKTGTPLTLGVEQRAMTVLFTDLQDFSSLAEQMEPNDLLSQLSVYFEAVSQAIAEEHGTVDKFIGDGIMAFWGAPVHRADHALRGCRGALRAARRMQRLNDEWSAEGRPRLNLRIGLHCAEVLVGNVGSSERLSYTVMGDGVNVAARLPAQAGKSWTSMRTPAFPALTGGKSAPAWIGC